MPKLVSEISSGQQFQRSADQGKLADSQTRVFRVLLDAPGELLNVQNICGVRIGDRHPYNPNIFCTSFDAKYEGDSRVVVLVTFNYQSTPASQGEDKNKNPPDIRPANWTTSTSLMEVPVQTWQRIKAIPEPPYFELDIDPLTKSATEPAMNPAGDMYDGLSRYDVVVTISIEQYCQSDPTAHLLDAGSVNKETIRLGSLEMPPGSVLFRGVQFKPTVESWGDLLYRGWTASYEFAFRRNHVKNLWNKAVGLEIGSGWTYDADIGWDIAVPQTGFNVKTFDPATEAEATRDPYGQPLSHTSGKTDNPPKLPTTLASNERARAMVRVHSYDDGGASQLPSAQPIPLNDDGRPRMETANPKVLVKRYRVLPEVDFTTKFKLRLY